MSDRIDNLINNDQEDVDISVFIDEYLDVSPLNSECKVTVKRVFKLMKNKFEHSLSQFEEISSYFLTIKLLKLVEGEVTYYLGNGRNTSTSTDVDVDSIKSSSFDDDLMNSIGIKFSYILSLYQGKRTINNLDLKRLLQVECLETYNLLDSKASSSVLGEYSVIVTTLNTLISVLEQINHKYICTCLQNGNNSNSSNTSNTFITNSNNNPTSTSEDGDGINTNSITILEDIFAKCFAKIHGSFKMLTSSLSTEAFVSWRTLHEAECILKLLIDNSPAILETYNKHIVYNNAFRGGLKDDPLLDQIFKMMKSEMKSHSLKSKDMKKFIEYGWMYKIKEFDSSDPKYKLNFRDGVERCASLSSYNKWYELASEITHSSPVYFYSNEEVFFDIALLRILESTLRVASLFIHFYNYRIVKEDENTRFTIDYLYSKSETILNNAESEFNIKYENVDFSFDKNPKIDLESDSNTPTTGSNLDNNTKNVNSKNVGTGTNLNSNKNINNINNINKNNKS